MPVRTARILSLLLVLLCPLSGTAAERGALRPVTLQLKWYHQFQFAGYYTALEKGYYRDAGLDVTIREGNPTEDPIADVVSGKAEFGIGASELVLARARGKPVVAVAVILQHSPLILLARHDARTESFHNLLGRKIQLVPHEYELYAFLQAMGYSLKNFQVEPRTANLDALINGSVAAVSAYSTDEPFILERRNIDYLSITPRSAGIDFYGDTLFTSEQELARSPATVAAFRAASLRGWHYALEHPEEIAHLIRTRYGSTHSEAHLLYEANAMSRLILPDLVELGYMSRGRWQHIADVYQNLGMLPRPVDFDQFIYAPDAHADLTPFYWGGGIALILLLAGGGIVLYIARLNRRLRASERRHRVLYESAPVAIIVWDRAYHITGWNHQAEQMFGWEAGEVLGRSFFDFMIPADERERVRTAIAPVLDRTPEAQSLNWNITKQGERILCEWMNAALYDDEGNMTGIIAQAVDVTERVRLQEQLSASEGNYRTMAETAPFPVVVTRLSDNSVLFINKRAEEQFGVDRNEAVGYSAPDYWVDPAERNRMIDLLRRQGRVTDFEAQLHDGRGRAFWVYLSAALTTFDDQPAAFVSFNDISERKRIEEALRASEQRYRLLAENVVDVIWTMDMSGRFTYVSPSVQRLRGYSPEEVMRQPMTAALTDESARLVAGHFEHLATTGELLRNRWELEQPCRDGSTVWTDILINVIRDDAGRAQEIVGITRDITEQHRLREELNIRSVAIESAAEAIIVTDANGIIEYVNPAFTRMTGFSREEAVGQSPNITKSTAHSDDFYRQMWSTIVQGDIWRGEITNRRKDGSLYTEVMAIAPVRDSRGSVSHFVAIKHDVTDRKQLEERLQHLAHYDVLTDLPNRALFFDRLERALVFAKRLRSTIALLYIDLDGFKEVNDSFGHDIGDLLLQAAARRLQEAVRESDTVARIGGDEFIVILKNIAVTANAEAVAGKIIASLSETIHIQERACRIGASVGISLYPQHGSDGETLLARADQAMYRAKNQGKNRYTIYSD